ncbi:MAG TPA: hypothetical protein VMU81_12160, partial [Acetobacteraceae bacterium]|nr:hypothetical protein [Acetobacteraceae bacterium]
MISNALTSPAYAYSPDADRVGLDASARLLHRLPLLYALVRFLVLVAFLVREYWLAIRQYCAGKRPSSGYCRSGLPPGSAEQPAASIRGAFGNAIAWTSSRRGIAPRHKGWPDLSPAIVTFNCAFESVPPSRPRSPRRLTSGVRRQFEWLPLRLA